MSATGSALRAYAGSEHATADRVATHAATGRTAVAALSPTFGIIGAEFLAALGAALDARARAAQRAAVAHRDVAEHTGSADTAYRSADANSATRLAHAGEKELAL